MTSPRASTSVPTYVAVRGRSDLSWDESVRIDVRYVENWSLGLDLAILLRTIRAVLHGPGAY